jgi:predicted nucleic acid-binding protein
MSLIALDTNVLVKAFRDEDAAGDALRALLAHRASQGSSFAVPVFCVGEFWKIVTDRRAPIRVPPAKALAWVDHLVTEGASLIAPGSRYWQTLRSLLASQWPAGTGVFDCQIAALCSEHGIGEIWTFDRAFVKHPHLRAVDPLTLPDAG